MLKEFIRLLLIQESTFADNMETMARLSDPDVVGSRGARKVAMHPADDQTYWSDYFRHPSRDRRLFRDISRSPELRTKRVVKFLGAGSEGIAFLMDDGSVLKLGQMHTGLKPDSNYLERVPWKYRDAQDLRVHGLGRAHINMERLIPFQDWISERPDGRRLNAKAGQLARTAVELRRKGAGREEIHAELMTLAKDGIAERMAVAFARQSGGRSLDLSPRNLGVRETPDGPEFVFYDF